MNVINSYCKNKKKERISIIHHDIDVAVDGEGFNIASFNVIMPSKCWMYLIKI